MFKRLAKPQTYRPNVVHLSTLNTSRNTNLVRLLHLLLPIPHPPPGSYRNHQNHPSISPSFFFAFHSPACLLPANVLSNEASSTQSKKDGRKKHTHKSYITHKNKPRAPHLRPSHAWRSATRALRQDNLRQKKKHDNKLRIQKHTER